MLWWSPGCSIAHAVCGLLISRILVAYIVSSQTVSQIENPITLIPFARRCSHVCHGLLATLLQAFRGSGGDIVSCVL